MKKEAVPTAETVEIVKDLVQTAIAIDGLNLQWAQQNRYGAAVFQGRPFSQQEVKN